MTTLAEKLRATVYGDFPAGRKNHFTQLCLHMKNGIKVAVK
jgi:hypothetical protein